MVKRKTTEKKGRCKVNRCCFCGDSADYQWSYNDYVCFSHYIWWKQAYKEAFGGNQNG